MYRFCVLMLFIILTTCFIVLSFVFVLLLLLLLLLNGFMWYPFHVARYLYISSICLYWLSFFVVCFVFATFCISFVLITWLCTLKDQVNMILFYYMSLWYISIMNYYIRWTTNVKIIQSRSGINYFWILINSIYNFWTSLNLGLFLKFILTYFWFFNPVC